LLEDGTANFRRESTAPGSLSLLSPTADFVVGTPSPGKLSHPVWSKSLAEERWDEDEIILFCVIFRCRPVLRSAPARSRAAFSFPFLVMSSALFLMTRKRCTRMDRRFFTPFDLTAALKDPSAVFMFAPPQILSQSFSPCFFPGESGTLQGKRLCRLYAGYFYSKFLSPARYSPPFDASQVLLFPPNMPPS